MIAGFSILIVLNLVLMSIIFIGMRHLKHRSFHHNHDMKENFHRTPPFFRHLDLSEEQEQEMRKIRDDFMTTSSELEDEMDDIRNELSELLKTHPNDEEMMQKLTDSIGSVQSELEKSMFEHLRSVRALCNDEQLEKLESSMERLKHKHHKKFRKHYKKNRKRKRHHKNKDKQEL